MCVTRVTQGPFLWRHLQGKLWGTPSEYLLREEKGLVQGHAAWYAWLGFDKDSTSFPRQVQGLSAFCQLWSEEWPQPQQLLFLRGSSARLATAALSLFHCLFTMVFNNPVFVGSVCSSSPRREGKIILLIMDVSFNQHHLTLWELNFYLSLHTLNRGLYLFLQNWFAIILSFGPCHVNRGSPPPLTAGAKMRGEDAASQSSCCWVTLAFPLWIPPWGCSLGDHAICRQSLDKRGREVMVWAEQMAFLEPQPWGSAAAATRTSDYREQILGPFSIRGPLLN